MKRLFWAAATALTAFAPMAVQAQTRLLPSCTANGNCGISDILAVFINVVELILGLVGAVTLGVIVYAGFKIIISPFDASGVKQARDMLKNAVIGLLIIFTAGIGVRFAIRTLTGGTSSVPTIGESCDPGTKRSAVNGAGLWVSIPAGVGSDGKIIPEGLVCVKKETGLAPGAGCTNLNSVLKERGRSETYRCIEAAKGQGCVRGLCNLGSDYACCR